MNLRTLIVAGALLSGGTLAAAACSSDPVVASDAGTTPTMDGAVTTPDSGPAADSGPVAMNICLTVGGGDAAKGAAGIDGVIDQAIGKIAADCTISTFFTSLPPAQLAHVGECLKTQVKELFGCPNVKYEGSKDSKGAVCRDMKTAHAGLGITEKDYDALIADLVSVIPAAVKSHPDFPGIAAALTAAKEKDGTLKNVIIENKASTSNSQSICDGGAD